MYNTPKVSFKVVKKEKERGIFEITPLVRGFGHTIGSALRRTLYSSIEGAAITEINIEGVNHEFTTIEGMQDDILQVLLNFKKVRFNKKSKDPVELYIEKKGKGDVVASDIQDNSDCKVVNKDLVITSLDNAKGSFKAKIKVESGYGYVTSDEKEQTAIGNILLDARFSPIVNVEYEVESTRVGKETDFDKLTLTVTTDESIDPEDAIRESAKVLKEFFFKVETGRDFTEEDNEAMQADNLVAPKEDKVPVDEVLIDELRFPTRTINALKKAGIKTLGDLAAKSEDELLNIRNLGERSIIEIISFLKEEGLK